MLKRRQAIFEIIRKDPRYPYKAYEFIFEALDHTLQMFERIPPDESSSEDQPKYHVSGRELLEGVRDLAVLELGRMAPIVFRLWNVLQTEDVGNIVYNLIEADQLSTSDNDRKEDFSGVFDLERALTESFSLSFEGMQRLTWGNR
jgi:uncharacterized repeat protein (TIGR04138 family)